MDKKEVNMKMIHKMNKPLENKLESKETVSTVHTTKMPYPPTSQNSTSYYQNPNVYKSVYGNHNINYRNYTLPQTTQYQQILTLINDLTNSFRTNRYGFPVVLKNNRKMFPLKKVHYIVESKYKVSYKWFRSFCKKVSNFGVYKEDKKHYLYINHW